MNKYFARMMVALCLSIGLVGTVVADPIATLTDENSTVQFDLGSGGVGMNQWTIDDEVNRLREQSFWYQVGNTAQQRVNTLTLSSWGVVDQNLLKVKYSDPSNRFTMQLSFYLTGSSPGSGQADIGETVKIQNSSGAPLDFHLYEYVDVDILGLAQPVDSLLQLTGTPKVNTATQTNGVATVTEGPPQSQTVDTPAPSLFEAGNAAQLLSKLSSGSLYNLNGTSSAADDDLAWAFQWDALIASSGSLLISKDKMLDIPEPSTLALLGIGAVSLLAYAWRRRQRTA